MFEDNILQNTITSLNWTPLKWTAAALENHPKQEN